METRLVIMSFTSRQDIHYLNCHGAWSRDASQAVDYSHKVCEAMQAIDKLSAGFPALTVVATIIRK